jgi:hypothetical protein
MDFVVSGTLHTRTKVCGRPNCRCAHDPEARHGPYHEWSRRLGGRLVHSVVAPEKAAEIGQAIKNYREIQTLLADWEAESTKELLGTKNRQTS